MEVQKTVSEDAAERKKYWTAAGWNGLHGGGGGGGSTVAMHVHN